MKVFISILAALAAISTPSVRADDYTLANGYISFRGSGGVIRDLRLDPAGKGEYGPVMIREAYVGEQPKDPANGSLPFELADDTITLKNVRVYASPREVGVDQYDTPVRLEKGDTLGQSFYVDRNGVASVSVRVPTWTSAVSGLTLRVYKGDYNGSVIVEKRFENIADNSWVTASFPAQDKGAYYIEISDPRGPVGWWTSLSGPKVGQALVNRQPLDLGSRSFRARVYEVFPAQVRISAVGPKLFAEVQPDEERRKFTWKAVTPFVRDGYETRDPQLIPFSRFYSDTGQYMPIAQLKRRADVGYGMPGKEWIRATGNGSSDLIFGVENESMSWSAEPDSMTLGLGRKLSITARPHSEDVPEFYPVFCSSDRALDRSLNSFFYDRAYSWPSVGTNPDWFEWLALIHFWNYRPGSLEFWRQALLTCKIDDDGYVYTWGDAKGWPFPDNAKYDTRHFTTNPNFILACYRFYAWTRDKEFLEKNADRIRQAMEFMLSDLKGNEGILILPDKDHGGTPDDVASNYWDDLPFGGKSAYENAYFYASLGAMAAIESALDNADKAKDYNTLRDKCRKAYNELFWNEKAGRYVGCIDKAGTVRDYGFTYVNLEAAFYGLPDAAQAARIYHWMEQDPTSSGKTDTYARYRFAPRVNTIDCKDWWYLNGKGEIPSQPFDTHLENGGAILYTSGYDIMARAKYLGADNAFRRLRAILDRYEEPDRLCGGAPLLYGENNGWQVGTDVPFPESGLAPASFLRAFLGIQATSDGLLVTPNLPTELQFAGIRNLRYRGLMLDVKVTKNSVSITCDDPQHKINFQKSIAPGEGATLEL